MIQILNLIVNIASAYVARKGKKMVEQIKRAMGGWSFGKDINIGTMITLIGLGLMILWSTKDKFDTIGHNQIKLVQVEFDYIAADSTMQTANQTQFVSIGAAITSLQQGGQRRDLALEKMVVTQGFVLEKLDAISERLD